MIRKFDSFAALLLEWNQRIHLVSQKDATGERIMRHFVDSLSIFKAFDLPKDTNLLDLGSGAGFPAIPIKIVRDDVKMTLVESIHKKTLFLQKICEVLEFQKNSILNQRAEKLTDKANFEKKFDLVTAKALGRLEDIARLAMPFLKTGGLLVAYKGKGVRGEMEKVGSLKECRIEDVIKIEVPEMDLLRWVVVVKKVG